MTIRTIDIPQADALASVRRLIEAMLNSQTEVSTGDLAAMTGFSDRHVRYRMATARILDLVSERKKGPVLTARGRRLLRTAPGTLSEKRQFRLAVEACPIVRQIVPDLLSAKLFDFEVVSRRIAKETGLSPATAERRAQVLRAWRRQLA